MGSSNDLFTVGSLKLWVSGQAYQPADRVVDPVDCRMFYRITAAGSSGTRPALDYANWALEGYPTVPTAIPASGFDVNISMGAWQNGPQKGVQRAGGIAWSYSPAQGGAWVDAVTLTGRGCMDLLVATQTSQASGSNYRILVDDVVVQSGLFQPGYTSGLQYVWAQALIGGGDFYITDNAYAVGGTPFEVDFERSFKLQVTPNHASPAYQGAMRYKLRK